MSAITLSMNEIRSRAMAFAREWQGRHREEAEAQTFENEFFAVFGIHRRKVASMEHRVQHLDGSRGYIDLFWRGQILIEMKTTGKDMAAAYHQARNYVDALPQHDVPKGILICDFATWHYYDLDDNGSVTVFNISDFPQKIELFAYLAGYNKTVIDEQDPVNIEAAERMGALHDRLKAIGYTGHRLEIYLMRILFCLFADDTAIFGKDDFLLFLRHHTAEDGADLAEKLARIFETLNTPVAERLTLQEDIYAPFPYVNGGLFAEHLPMAAFDSAMRGQLIQCSTLDWSKISPAIFGSMFQSVMDSTARRDLGAHYTSEKNILKAIKPLFLDDLRAELDRLLADRSTRKVTLLKEFHSRLGKLTFLDPACGCGNFLVITYRELRLIELEILLELQRMNPRGNNILNVEHISQVSIQQFYGIEIEEFPARVAETALWLIEHQMNMRVGTALGQFFANIPIQHSATIVNGNALTLDWQDIVRPDKLCYIIGNPPFAGGRLMSTEQKADLARIFEGVPSAGNLDFVACWHKKAARFIQGTRIECAFVSTNSICQGEQVGILWRDLIEKEHVFINFAHQTFKWSNEARHNAGVYCIIVGFALHNKHTKSLFVYESPSAEPHQLTVQRINAYLVEGSQIFLPNRSTPISNVPKCGIGNKPIDDGNYLFTQAEMETFLLLEPSAAPYFKKWWGAQEFINNAPRWCLWLGDCPPDALRKLPHALQRIENVRQFRLASSSEGTRRLAQTPTRFHVENMPTGHSILIPRVSSERREYIPMGYIPHTDLGSDSCTLIPDASMYHFGVLTSRMHNAWTRYVCGRLESRYRYSVGIVYNNFPWAAATPAQEAQIAALAAAVLDARAQFPSSSLADLYDPRTMPPTLSKAHARLDSAVDKLYARTAFPDDSARVAHLFELYQAQI